MKWIALLLVSPLMAQVQDNQVVTKRFAVSAAPEIVVSVVTGDIRVTSHGGSEVVLTAKVHYEAGDTASLADLQRRIRFESEQSGNNIWIGMDSDNNWDGGSSRRPREFGWRGKTPPSSSHNGSRGWRFRHDVELQVPRTAHLKLSTVNGSAIYVEGVTGEFRLNNVNGGIEVKDADGFGRAHTVNGPVTLSFKKNPSGPVSLKSINGKIHLYLLKGLNADFKIKTFNAKTYTDFMFNDRPLPVQVTQTSDGMKRIWSSHQFAGARVGSGGPEIEIDGFNGDIHILERK